MLIQSFCTKKLHSLKKNCYISGVGSIFDDAWNVRSTQNLATRLSFSFTNNYYNNNFEYVFSFCYHLKNKVSSIVYSYFSLRKRLPT